MVPFPNTLHFIKRNLVEIFQLLKMYNTQVDWLIYNHIILSIVKLKANFMNLVN